MLKHGHPYGGGASEETGGVGGDKAITRPAVFLRPCSGSGMSF